MRAKEEIKALKKENDELQHKILELEDFKSNETTSEEGSADFPVTVNEYIASVEKIAIQESEGLKSANKLDDGMKLYDVNDGSVIEKSVVAMAKSTMFDRDAWDKTPVDPTAYARYFNNWEKRQYPVTVRRDDIRKIVANKGVSVDDFVTEILDTLTQGEGNEDYINQVLLLQRANFIDFRSNLGGIPKTMKGVIYALRKAYNHLKANNNDMCSLHNETCASRESDIRIAVSSDLLNLIDVVELAHVFNLSKEELFGKLVIYDLTVLKEKGYSEESIKLMSTRAFIYDINSIIKGVRLREITKDESGKGRFVNFYLTVDRLYAHCGLFKGCYINCAEACISALNDVIQDPTMKTVTDTLSHVTSDDPQTEVELYGSYNKSYTCAEGYNLNGEGAVATATMGSARLEGVITISEDGKHADINVPVVSDNLTITLTAVAD